MDIAILYGILIFITAPVVGYFLAQITKDEKNLTRYYFPALMWTLAIVTAINLTLKIQYALTTGYMLLAVMTWFNIHKKKTSKK